MRTVKAPRSGLVAVLVAGAALAPVSAGLASADGGSAAKAVHKARTPKVKVVDDYFSPEALKVNSGSKVKFKWDGTNTNSHNVTLQKGPKRVKKSDFASATGSIGIRFNPKFKKKGTYDFICTIHPETMKLTVTVKH